MHQRLFYPLPTLAGSAVRLSNRNAQHPDTNAATESNAQRPPQKPIRQPQHLGHVRHIRRMSTAAGGCHLREQIVSPREHAERQLHPEERNHSLGNLGSSPPQRRRRSQQPNNPTKNQPKMFRTTQIRATALSKANKPRPTRASFGREASMRKAAPPPAGPTRPAPATNAKGEPTAIARGTCHPRPISVDHQGVELSADQCSGQAVGNLVDIGR